MIKSRFATKEEIFSEEFYGINKLLFQINQEYGLVNHSEINKERFDWFDKIEANSQFYASRMWEYPFAILSSNLEMGMKCADIGCGTTPFTIYLAQQAGKENVTGFDPDLIQENTATHYAFGIKNSFINKTGILFKPNNMTNIDSSDDYFDRVYCISVLEHIAERKIQLNGIKEMSRILKPGGRLILTIDIGINSPLTNPLELILHSGLIPLGEIDLNWPEKRFIKIENIAMDVFGIVLVKPNKTIFSDYKSTQTIKTEKLFQKFIPEIYSNSEYQIIKDLKSKFGFLKFILKKILNKYK